MRSNFEEKPKSIAEKATRMFALGFDHDRDWERQAESLAALDQLTKADVSALLQTVLAPATARRIVVLLAGVPHAPSTATSTFTDRDRWKATQTYE
ncbi:MAG: hypothetical protein K9M98_06165 [Cephaloticoccus sp.]|nr:hypothetical protein [Cephaloticoccus sp.]MCF7760070.1 hypothetical protein [Cephaloticoccus sp.]